MAISRHWIGLAHKHKADEYMLHLQNDTFTKLRSIPGFIKADILNRELNEGVEFLIITEWESIEAIKKFAGENFEIAVVPEVVHQMMIRFDSYVRHYEIT